MLPLHPKLSSNWRVKGVSCDGGSGPSIETWGSVMKISAAAKAAGLPVKTVRYYADIGLVSAPLRTAAGYRTYDDRSVLKLVFVRRAREFGFSIDECRELLGLYEDRHRSSADVRRIASARLAEIERKAAGTGVSARRTHPPRRRLQGRSQAGLSDHRQPGQPTHGSVMPDRDSSRETETAMKRRTRRIAQRR